MCISLESQARFTIQFIRCVVLHLITTICCCGPKRKRVHFLDFLTTLWYKNMQQTPVVLFQNIALSWMQLARETTMQQS